MLYEKTDLKNDLGIEKIEMNLPEVWNEEKPLAGATVTLTNGEKLTDFYLNQYDSSFLRTEIEVKIPVYIWRYIESNHPITENSYNELEHLLLSTYREAENHFSDIQVKDERTPAEKLLLKSDEAFDTVFNDKLSFQYFLDVMAQYPEQLIYNDMAVFLQTTNYSDLRTLAQWQSEGFSPIDIEKKVYLIEKSPYEPLAEYYDISNVHNPNEQISIENEMLRGKEPSKPKSRQAELSENQRQLLNELTKSSDIIQSITQTAISCSSDKVIQNVIGYVLAKHYNLDTSSFDVESFVTLHNRHENRKSTSELKDLLQNCHAGVKSSIKRIDTVLKENTFEKPTVNIEYEAVETKKTSKVKKAEKIQENKSTKQTEKPKSNGLFKQKSSSNSEKTQALMREIEKGVKEVFKSKNYIQYLKTMSAFHSYSFRNNVLIMMQKPEATRVAGFETWKKIGRYVKKGEKGIRIIAFAPRNITVKTEVKDKNGKPVLDEKGNPKFADVQKQVPAYKAVSVFDISQTQGEPLPELTTELKDNVKNYTAYYNALLKTTKFNVSFASESELGVGTKGLCNYAENTILIKTNMSESQTIKTLAHEIAHAHLHSKNKAQLSREQKETEAESVAFVLCEHLGFDTSEYSFPYVAAWSSDKELKVLENSLETIQKEANSLITEFDEALKEITREKSKQKENNIKKTPMKEQIKQAREKAQILNGNRARQRQQQLAQNNIQYNRKEVARNVK